MAPSKIVLLVAFAVGVAGFNSAPAFTRISTALFNVEKGAGGMFDTRNPDEQINEDPRKSISAAPSFEEYMKQRGGGAAAPAPAPAPAYAAPPAPAPAPAYTPPPAPAYPPAAPAPQAGGAVSPPGSSGNYLDSLSR